MGGDPDQALLLMPYETIQELNSEGWPIEPGHMGENITTRGIPYNGFRPGKIFRVGEAEIQISKACSPCDNLQVLPYVGKTGCPAFLRALINRRGWYARVLKEGTIAREDAIEEL